MHQATLDWAGVRDAVIDWLVGHSHRGTRATSYTTPSMAQLRAAVTPWPPIAGIEPTALREFS